jgi:electron transfer flavoprotein alpha subunit
MSMTTCLVVADDPAIAHLVQLAHELGGDVVAVVAGSRETADVVARSGVGSVVLVEAGEGAPVEALAHSVARAVLARRPTVLLAANRSADRALLGAAAAQLGAPVLAGVETIAVDGDTVTIEAGELGGIVQRRVTSNGPVAAVVDGGTVPQGDGPVAVEPAEAAPYPMRVVGTRAAERVEIDLGAASRVVAAGRGLKERADLGLIEALAAALGAEIGCSRPLAEGLGWLPKQAYIGVSGQKIAPALYVAVGISGQQQHTAGVRDARTVVVINNDANAPFVQEADIAVIGDLYEIVPALTEALR